MPIINLTIQGMHCHSCKMLIEDVCKDVSGVQDCSVDFETGHMTINHDGTVDTKRFKQEIETLGTYKVEEIL